MAGPTLPTDPQDGCSYWLPSIDLPPVLQRAYDGGSRIPYSGKKRHENLVYVNHEPVAVIWQNGVYRLQYGVIFAIFENPKFTKPIPGDVKGASAIS